jgi:RES domain-containing protein
MASAWRIVRASRAKTAFTGQGPWQYGGRWNSPGVRVVYLRANKLPANWRISPPSRSTMEIGDHWALERRSAILALPSAISPADTNFLLNPEHPDFKRIRIAPPVDYDFDARLLNR